MPDTYDELFAVVRKLALKSGLGRIPTRVYIRYVTPTGKVVTESIAVPNCQSQVPTVLDTEFVPSDSDQCILEALEGKSLRTAQLEKASGLDHATLFRRLKVLRVLNPPLVLYDAMRGYYRPDAPPPNGTMPILNGKPSG